MFNRDIKQHEIEEMLGMLKETLKETVCFPLPSKAEIFQVQGESGKDVFDIKIYRGSINTRKCNLGALISFKKIPLLELHINPGNKHTNPDGTIIKGSHWHVLSESNGREIAYPAEDINSELFVENTVMFLDRFHVVKKPDIQYLTDLL